MLLFAKSESNQHKIAKLKRENHAEFIPNGRKYGEAA
jgi:hypothetical protein